MDDVYFSLVEERSKRLLCLDARDLSLLPISYEAWVRDNPDCLWRNKSSRYDRKEYFEFIIKPKGSDDSEESTHKICHLCNAIVPTAYVTEHVNSSKHLAFQRIAETGLERARRHRHMTGIESLKDNSEYYCEHCLLLINVSNQNEHEKSKAHKNLAIVDGYLKDFAYFYATNNPDDIFDFKINKNNDSNEANSFESEDEVQDFDVLPFKINKNQTVLDKDLVVDNNLEESQKIITTTEPRLDSVKEINDEVESFSVTHEEASNEVESLLDTHKEASNKVESLSDTRKEASNKVESLSDTHKEVSNKVESLSDTHKEASNEVELLSDTHKAASYKVQSLSDTHKEASNEVELLSDTYKQASNKVESPSDAHKEASNTVESPSDAHKEASNTIESPSDAHKEASNTVESPSDAHKEKNNKVGAFSDDQKEMNMKDESPCVAHKELNNKVESPSDVHKEINYEADSHCDAYKEMNNNDISEENNHERWHSLDQYIERLKEYGTVKLHKLNPSIEDRVKIETDNGCELHVSIHNFDGFKRVGRHFQCKMCNISVTSICMHRQLGSHVAVTAKPIMDKHCIRPIRGSFSHCMICNEVIDNVVVHTQLKSHLQKLEKALVKVKNNPSNNNVAIKLADSKNSAETPKLAKTDADINSYADKKAIETTDKNNPEKLHYCHPCDLSMHVNNLASHLAGTKHAINVKGMVSDCMIKNTKDHVTCKVCQTNVCNNNKAVNIHITSFIHIKNYNDCLTTNEVIKAKDKFFCKCCGQKIVKMRELLHIEGHSHKVKLAAYKIGCIENNDIIRNIEIKFLNETVNTMELSTKNNMDVNEGDKINDKSDNSCTDSHGYKGTLRNQNNKEFLNDDNSKVTDNETLVCNDARINEIRAAISSLYENNAWNTKFPNNTSGKKLSKYTGKKKKWDATLTAVNNLLGDMELMHLIDSIDMDWQRADGKDVMFNCIVCNVKVNMEDVDKHIDSREHVRIHRELMNANELKFKKDRYVCYACTVYVAIGKESRHIVIDEHKKRIEELKNGDYVLVYANDKALLEKIGNDLKAEEDEADTKVLSDLSDSKIDVADVKHHFRELYGNKTQLICILCQELVENSEIQYRIHTNDVKHGTKYTAVLIYNRIFKIENGFACGYCENTVSDELAHIATDKHVMYQKNNPEKNYCSICHLLPSKEFAVKDHVTSKLHLKNLGVPLHYYCNICDLQVIDDVDNIEKHNESFEHQNNYSIINDNKVILMDNHCVCDVCEAEFCRDGFDDHINTVSHAMLLHNNHYQLTTDYCSNL